MLPRRRFAVSLFFAALLFAPLAAQAQTPGTVRQDSQLVDPNAADAIAPAPIPLDQIDPREEMRRFVQAIGTYARRLKRDFAVVPSGGLDLLVKRDPIDFDKKLPATTYMRSIAGVMQTGLFYGVPEIGKPTEDKRREALLPLAERARENGLPVLVMDYARTAQSIREAQATAAKNNFLFYAAPERGLRLNTLAGWPSRPFHENPNPILSLSDVKNFAALRDSSPYGQQDAFALKMHGTNYDLLIVDVFHRLGEPLTKQAVETLKYKKLGAKRLVFAWMNIGTAASYAYYWQPGWQEGAPLWISAPTPADPDRYFVEYWQPEWQRIITGNTDSYLYGLIQQGFDGVILEGLDSYRFFEGGLDAYNEGPGGLL